MQRLNKLWKLQPNFPFSINVVAPCRPCPSGWPCSTGPSGSPAGLWFGSGPSPHHAPEWYPWLSHSFAGYSLISPLKRLHYFQLPKLVKTNLLSYYSLKWFHHDPSSQPSLHKSSTLCFPQSKLPTRPVQPLNSLHPHPVDCCDFFLDPALSCTTLICLNAAATFLSSPGKHLEGTQQTEVNKSVIHTKRALCEWKQTVSHRLLNKPV